MNYTKCVSLIQFKAPALTALTAFAVMVGCSGGGVSERVARTDEALSANAGDVLGFEVPTDWHVTSSPSLALSSSTTRTQGTKSLAVAAQNYVSIQSAPISVTSAITGPVSYDLLLPPPANQFWAGATQLFVDCHSHNLFNQYVGQTELTGLPTGKFTTIQMPLPAAIAAGLSQGCSDLQLTVVLNVGFNQTGNYLIDNLQLDGPPATNSCGTTPASLGNGGVVGPTVTFSSTLVRPDLGTFSFNASLAGGSATNETYTVKLNGQPLYQVSQQGAPGAVTRSDTYFAPITGVHQATSTSDGTNITFVVDGRTSLPMAVTANPSSIKFVDGGPAPAISIPPSIGDAIAELFTDAATKIKSCATTSTAATVAGSLLAAVGTDQGHPSGDDGHECTAGEEGCIGAEAACVAAAIAAALACGPAAFICGGAGAVGCALGFQGCLGFVHRSGTDCCPVDCGGASGVETPIGGCCLSGETCLRQENSSHVGICCSAGQTACGGSACCGSDTTCMPVQGGTSTCCKPSQINPQGQCCPGGIGTNGQCCLLGACTNDTQCTSTEGACVNGCCTIG